MKLLLTLLLTTLVGTGAAQDPETSMTVIDKQRQTLALPDFIDYLARQRVVFVGEQHDRYEHHLNQLAIIQALHRHAPEARWAIGLEFVQQPFQKQLDAYIAGELSERDLLTAIEYFDRWGYDYRLYRPIFQYAKEHAIPLIALNIDRASHRPVGVKGLAGLSPQERALLPQDIDQSDAEYKNRLRAIFQQHPEASDKDFDKFWQAQLVWDEAMAERTARYLAEHPDRSVIILAGRGHIEYGSGIPSRVLRRLPADSAILLNAESEQTIADFAAADYWLLTEPAELPASGKMGIMLDLENGVSAGSVLADSAAEKAGIEANDRILAIDGQAVATLADLRLALLDRKPGERIRITLQRAQQTLDLTLTLAD